LNPTEEDLQLLLAAKAHIGTKNLNARMKPYVFKRRSDGTFIFITKQNKNLLLFKAFI
jgi:small subunit ribosomal protein SAe